MTIQSSSSPQSTELIRDFLQTHHSGVLATSDKAANPHAATIYFSVNDELRLVFATKTETQKYKNIEENEQVAFVCYDESSQTTVQIQGTAKKTDDPQLRQAALDTMYHSSASLSKTELPPAEKLFAGDYAAIVLDPLVIKMGIFKRPDAESNEELFESITFAR